MSLIAPVENRIQESLEAARAPIKCRIPQRLPHGSFKSPNNSNTNPRARTANHSDAARPKFEAVSSPNTRFGAKNTRLRGDDVRPKSANRLKEELFSNRPYSTARSARPPSEKTPFVPKRPSTLIRKSDNHRNTRPIIMVPVTQAQRQRAGKMFNNTYFLPDQETIRREEDEQRLCESSDSPPVNSERFEGDSFTSRSELKIAWQDKAIQFERMKIDLKERQKGILELYAVMRNTHKKLMSLGENTSLPPAEDLQIMNVSKLTPDQLLHLCAGDDITDWRSKVDGKIPLPIDLTTFYDIPNKLLDTCEQTLSKRKEIIDWFESLTSEKKGVKVHTLQRKINEFNAENNMLKYSLDEVKSEFQKKLEEIINIMKKGVNETMALQLHTEELTYEMSELNSQNADLRKQIHNAEHLRPQLNKNRVEELEKELKEEKCKRILQRDRLSRAEGQVKINVERASQLEAALEQARSQTRSLQRTVQQLHDQNEKLQSDFDAELSKLTESIREHTVHLEEIAEAREKLQTEKEDLEKRLAELSLYYNESLQNVKQEMNVKVAKLIETENKIEEQEEDKEKLQAKVESLCTQLLEAELHHKDLLLALHEKESQIEKAINVQNELEVTKSKLEKANLEIIDYQDRLTRTNEAMEEVKGKFEESVELIESLKCDCATKKEYAIELEKKQELLEQQLQENENKMEAYVEQLSSLKVHINQLQEDFGEFENLAELHEMVNEQRSKLIDATRQNEELTEALQKKNKELERYNENLIEQEQQLTERESIIKMLSEKEEEQTNIIKILRNNLELRSQADNDLSQQLLEKNKEIETLIANLETKKQHISNMEMIILTLEDQKRKASLQKKKDQDYIRSLQNKLTEFESFHMEATHNIETPAENLDSLIKILEDELGASIEPELRSQDYNNASKKKYIGDRNREDHEDNHPQIRYQSEPDAFPTKIVMGNFVKKTYIPSNDGQHVGDNLDRKKAITNIDTQKWISRPEPSPNMYTKSPSPLPLTNENLTKQRRMVPGQPQKSIITNNGQYLKSELRDDKKYKMFKLAGHRL